jgi:hypothetical protein
VQDIKFEFARDLLSEEMDIVGLIRNMRFVLAAVKQLVSREEAAQLLAKS